MDAENLKLSYEKLKEENERLKEKLAMSENDFKLYRRATNEQN